jgi:hypothetical protein
LAKHRVSDNAGGVKQHSRTLQRALRKERHFSLVEKVLLPTQARLVIVSGQELGPTHASEPIAQNGQFGAHP